MPALLALVGDMLSKGWAERALVHGEPIRVVGDWFRVTLGYNSGIAFGIFAGGGAWLPIVTGGVIAGLFTWLVWMVVRPGRPPLPLVPLGLILGGAVANLLDRLPDGRVTDFLDAGIGPLRWPAFNVADSAIVAGIALLFLASAIRGDGAQREHEEPAPTGG